ncbi:substrate-binding domain-containing protein [Leadbettera azotonutricia]|uniref:Phosphate ABC transporter n=1 Tax=Leadbettera azotonutricia (strain ATCC BAA-888 / DSM 13862 / ZAS-9) TaxID=545695 RepID=F5Y810_LEAAZ|nr:substrate-binding domain-containing protein [Leadbettera azotonutricia]AEF82885.1 phosphate ABC transporter [Leadbettera azotonutricia ZAS-9]
MKSIFRTIMASALLAGVFWSPAVFAAGGSQAQKKQITIISREDGSGTRSAFTELFNVLDANKADMTTDSAEITNNTAVMMTSVAGDINAIGYISLGSLDSTVKALKIDGVTASVANILNGSYKISRPFLIALKGSPTSQAADFISFIMSREGQAVIEKNGYIPMDNKGAFTGGKVSGKVIVAGSSSVTPVMEKLREAYLKINSGLDIEIQQSDSSTGMNAVISGICDIGMASRELKSSEEEKGLTAQTIAMDGIAVIVNLKNPLDGLSKDQVKDIFTGSVKTW